MQIESIIVSKCEQLLRKGVHFGASDILLYPTDQKFIVKFRKYNQLIYVEDLVFELGCRMISYFKFLSSLDISECRKPQSGAFSQALEDDLYSFRVSTLPSSYGQESVVIRILMQHTTVPIHQLCIQKEYAKILCQLVQQRQGLLLFTGATGSGKTTSLYSLLHYCSEELKCHVISLEDPVERKQNKILQIQVNERAGVTYALGLKAILRHSPDVIMIGEIRDTDTAQIAVEAALTGHLVLSTIHSKDTVNCIFRLLDLGTTLEQLRQTIIGIVAQTLVTIRGTDERKALFEILYEKNLQAAFDHINHNQHFTLPQHETLAQKMRMFEEGFYTNVYY